MAPWIWWRPHGQKLMEGVKEILERKGVPAIVQGPPGMFGIIFTEQEGVHEYRDWARSNHAIYSQILLKMMEKGRHARHGFPANPGFSSASHTDEDAGVTLQAFEDSVSEVLAKA